MGRKLNFTSLLFGDPTTTTTTSSSSSSSSSFHYSWAWPSCKQHPRTHSFRRNDDDDKAIYKTVYFDSTTTTTTTFSSSSEDDNDNDVSTTTSNPETDLIRGLIESGRFFFEAGSSRTSSLLVKEEADRGKKKKQQLLHDPIMVTVESEDPYGDFRRSMEEMVGAHKGVVGGDQWAWLEELLAWYLRVNGKRNHGYIVGAFVDLLVGLQARGEARDKAHEKEVISVNDSLESKVSGGGGTSDGDYGSCGSNSFVSSCEIEEVEEEEERSGG